MNPSYTRSPDHEYLENTYEYLQELLAHLIKHFDIKKPVRLLFHDDFATHKKSIKGAAQLYADGSATIHIRDNGDWPNLMIATLGHEFGHVVQYSRGYKPTGVTNWQIEIEATKIGVPVAIQYLRDTHPHLLPPPITQEEREEIERNAPDFTKYRAEQAAKRALAAAAA